MPLFNTPRCHHLFAVLGILWAVSGCEMIELVGKAPSPDASLPSCLPTANCNLATD